MQRLDPATLAPVRSARLPGSLLGYAWARHGSTLAVVVKPVATGQPVRILDARTLRVRRLLQVGDRDVCGLTFAGATLVALAADRPCYWPHGRFSILRFGPHGIASAAPVRGLSTLAPTNLVFGDGHAYIARRGGEIDSVDLRTGRFAAHRPRRVLAKGERIVATAWLGRHRVGVGPAVVDVRTWRARVPVAGATGIAGDAHGLVAWGREGADVLVGPARTHVLGGEEIGGATIAWPYLYARVGEATDVVDLRSPARQARVVPEPIELLPG